MKLFIVIFFLVLFTPRCIYAWDFVIKEANPINTYKLTVNRHGQAHWDKPPSNELLQSKLEFISRQAVTYLSEGCQDHISLVQDPDYGVAYLIATYQIQAQLHGGHFTIFCHDT